jgi:hypothetical protein
MTDTRSGPLTEIEDFVRERNRALTELDMDYARRTLPQASCDEVLLMSLHKARYECSAIAAELRHASRAWLWDRGLKRFDMSPLLPEGELP